MEDLDNEQIQSSPQVRPWVRSWAKALDFGLFQMIGLAWGLLAVRVDPQNRLLIVFSSAFFIWGTTYFLWILVDAFCLSYFGTTPGRWFLKIKVRNQDGSFPGFKQALMRTVKLWLFGFGMMIPWVTYVAQGWAFWRLRQDRITRWDRDTNLTVTHEPPGFWRMAIAIMGFCICSSVYTTLAHRFFTVH